MPAPDADLLKEANRVIREAVLDLRAAGHPAGELTRILQALGRESAGPGLPGEMVPYFIDDAKRCTATSILNYSASDYELDLPAGFAMEVSATRRDRFALPYYPDPGLGLLAADVYADRSDWTYGVSFVGQRGLGDPAFPQQLLVDPGTTRFHFLRRFLSEFVPVTESRVRVQVNPLWSAIHWQKRWPQGFSLGADRDPASWRSRYVESLAESRYVLCPRGVAANSIRFFETLAVCNIPIYVGNRETRFPLDWIIDWERACFRISGEEVASGAYSSRLHSILATPLTQVNRRRRYIFGIYHQFLAPERRALLDQLVLLRVRTLLLERLGQASRPSRRRRVESPAPESAATAPPAGLEHRRDADGVVAQAPPGWLVRWVQRRQTGMLRMLKRCPGQVTAVAVGEVDGGLIIATAHDNGTARCWDACNGRLLHAQTLHRDSIPSVAVGDLEGVPVVATAGNDGVARLWRAGGERVVTLEGHQGPVGCIALGAIGGRLVAATGGSDLTVRLWDARSGGALATLEGHGAAVWGVAIGELEGQPVVASASDDRSARLWDALSGRTLHRLLGHRDLVAGVAFGQVGGRPVLVTASDDRSARLWDVRSGRPLRTLVGDRSWIRGVAMGTIDNRSLVVTGSADGTIRTWDAATGRTIQTLAGRRAVCGLGLGSVDGRPVVVSTDGEAGVWDAQRPPSEDSAAPDRASIASVEVGDVDGELVVATAGDDGAVRLWRAGTGQPVRVLMSGTRAWSVAMGKLDGRSVVVAAGEDGVARFWESGSGLGLARLRSDRQGILGMAMADMGGLAVLATVGRDGAVRLRDAASGRLLQTIGLSGADLVSVAMADLDGEAMVAAASSAGSVHLFDPRSGGSRCLVEPDGSPIASLALGQIDGQAVVVTAGAGGRVRLFDARLGRPLDVVEVNGAVRSAGIGPRTLVLGGDMGIVVMEPSSRSS